MTEDKRESGAEEFLRLSREEHARKKEAEVARAPSGGSKPKNLPVPIAREEFHRWLQPAVVWRRLHSPYQSEPLAQEILSRLRQGKIRAAAELVTVSLVQGEGMEERHEFVTITPRIWRMAQVSNPTHRLWTFGAFAISPGATSNEDDGFTINPGLWASFTGVRFEPVGVAELADAMGVSLLTGEPLAPEAPAPSRNEGAGGTPLSRAPSVTTAPPPDDEIREVIRKVHAKGAKGRAIPKAVRAQPGFEGVPYKVINGLAEGLFPRVGRAGSGK